MSAPTITFGFCEPIRCGATAAEYALFEFGPAILLVALLTVIAGYKLGRANWALPLVALAASYVPFHHWANQIPSWIIAREAANERVWREVVEKVPEARDVERDPVFPPGELQRANARFHSQGGSAWLQLAVLPFVLGFSGKLLFGQGRKAISSIATKGSA